jgi:hypothetical protein
MKAKREFVLKEAIDYYNELLEDKELTQSSLDQLESRLKEARLIFGGRKLSPYLRPHFVTAEDWKRTVEICETIFGTLQKIKDAAVESEELLQELGITELEKDLVLIDPKYKQAAPTARLDSFLTEDTYSYVELNGESPAGIAFSDSASDIFLELPIMQKFAETYEIERLHGRPKLLETLLTCYEEYLGRKPETKPTIAIVDLKDLPTVEEFLLCKEFFEKNGYKSIICSPDEINFNGEKLMYQDKEPIDLVYRRLLVREYVPIIEEYPDLLNAYRAGAVCMANSFRGLLLHKKAMFAVQTNEKYAHLFNDTELAAIRKHIPWTRNFRDEQTEFYDEKIDLIEWTRANREKLVLKPNDDYGGHGIYIGWISNQEEWDKAIKHALEVGDYLIQERVKTAKEIFPYIDEKGEIQMSVQMVDLDPLIFNGKVGSAFTRLSTTELANVSSGGGMVPTMILTGKK